MPGPSRRRSAIRVHRTTWLLVAPLRVVERAFDQAQVLRLLDMVDVGGVLQEGTHRPGAPKLGKGTARVRTGTPITETGLEELMLAIIRRAGLPEPICQRPVLHYRPDFCWPAQRLLAEADGPARPCGREHDARRDVVLQNAG